MKKLLAMMLVLSLAAVTNAVIISIDRTSVPINETATITLTCDAAESVNGYSGYIELTDMVAASLTGLDSGAGVRGSLGFLDDDTVTGFPGNWHFGAFGPPGAAPVPSAVHFTFTYTAKDDNSVVLVNFYPESWDVVSDTLTITNTPEPMTLGLLGLGGLFLRRRK